MKTAQQKIADQIKAKGWVDIDMDTMHTLWPERDRMTREEIEAMIAAAIADNVPPKDAPTQAEQLNAWCAEHGFIRRVIPERRVVRFWVREVAQ